MAETRMTLPTLEQLRDAYINDVRRLKVRAGIVRPNVAEGSETWVRGEAVAATALTIMAREVALQDATMPDSATGDDLTRLAMVWRGIERSNGAGASGNVTASCTGTVVYSIGQQCTSQDGLRYEVTTTTIATTGTAIPVRAIDTGSRTDKAAGTVLTWSSPPIGSDTTCVVGASGLTNGADADTDAKLRQRLQDALRHPAASGSWSHYAQWAEEASAAVEKAFVYCAPQGPGTVHVAVTVEADADNAYTREANATLLNEVALAIVAESPEHADVLTTTVTDVDTTVVLRITAPEHRADGGLGGGWVDPVAFRWPNYYSSGGYYATRLTVAPSIGTVIRVDVLDPLNLPIAESHIAIWSTSQKKFYHSRVKSSTNVAGNVYDVVLYDAIDTTAIASGDYVSPDLERIDDYGALLASVFAGLGPGELTSSASLLPRAYRHPLQQEAWNSSFTSVHVGKLSIDYPEVTHVSVITPSLPASPAVASAVTNPPNILVLGKFAIYHS